MHFIVYKMDNRTRFPNLGQSHKDALCSLLDGNVSLDPLAAAIQELLFAAKKADNEAKVEIFKHIHDFVN